MKATVTTVFDVVFDYKTSADKFTSHLNTCGIDTIDVLNNNLTITKNQYYVKVSCSHDDIEYIDALLKTIDDRMEHQHIKNLNTIADFVSSEVKQENFCMSQFNQADDFENDEFDDKYKPFHQSKEDHFCGTAGCFAGYGPTAGVKSDADDWVTYAKDISGFGIEDARYEWLFGGEWQHTDNTPEGAAKRWYHLRDKGLPENWADQMVGVDPLTY